jgi:hypothetical protein
LKVDDKLVADTITAFGNVEMNFESSVKVNHFQLEGDSVSRLVLGSGESAIQSIIYDQSAILSIEGPGETAIINSNSLQKLCLGPVSLSNLQVTGATTWVVTDGSVDNVSGVVLARCEDVLAANFSVENSCKNANTILTDDSDGRPIKWNWLIQFGEDTILSQQSNDSSIDFSFQNVGLHDVMLSVEDSAGTIKSLKRTIEIKQNPLELLEIKREGGRLFTTIAGDSYTWFQDNEVIVGENQSSLPLSGLTGSSFYVRVTRAGCTQDSRPLLVLNIPDNGDDWVVIFPNPQMHGSDISWISKRKIIQVVVTDVAGKELKKIVDSNSLQLKEAGTYYIRFLFEDKRMITKKVIIK